MAHLQTLGRFDAVVGFVALDALVEGVAGYAFVGLEQPFPRRINFDAKSAGYGQSLAINGFQKLDNGGGHIAVELVRLPGFDGSCVQDHRAGMEDRANVVEADVQDAVRRVELWVQGIDHLQDGARFGGGEGGQTKLLLDAADARSRRAGYPAGVDKRLRFGDADFCRHTLFLQNIGEFQRAAGASRIEEDYLAVAQAGRASFGHKTMRKGGYDHHDHIGPSDDRLRVSGGQLNRPKALYHALYGNAPLLADVGDLFFELVVQTDRESLHPQVSGNGVRAVAGADDGYFFFTHNFLLVKM